MHTITNHSKGRHQVKTLDQGLVFLDPGDELTASLDPSYAKLVRNGLSLNVEQAGERPAGLVKADPGATAQADGANQTEQRQNGSGDDADPTDRDGWAKKAEGLGIEVKKSWGINRIKTEIEQVK